MKKPTPLNKENYFDFNELFFSTTDSRGIVEYGNDVFIRISGYLEEEIIGAPHNIIRHPDMPKAVFKLFWDTLKANSPIAAYVKNLAANGHFYWVFAFAFPVKDGYLSIRFKPSSPIFHKVQDVYAQVLEKEKQQTLEESAEYLLELVRNEGFESYEDFMVQAAIEELKYREKNLKHEEETYLNTNKISEVTSLTSHALDESFSKIDSFQSGSQIYSESIDMLQNEFNQLKFLSINMKVLAAKFGDKASTLGVISHEFSHLSGRIEENLVGFSNFVTELSSVIKMCSLNLAALKCQMIMVDFFVKESISKMSISQDAFSGMLKNRESFTTLFESSVEKLTEGIKGLEDRLRHVTEQIKEIHKFISGLEVIKQTGAIESARDDEIKKSFDYYLHEMDNFVALLRKTVSKLHEQKEELSKSTHLISNSMGKVSEKINELFNLALNR